MHTEIEVKCPNCGKIQNILTSKSLDIDLFHIECFECGKTFSIGIDKGEENEN